MAVNDELNIINNDIFNSESDYLIESLVTLELDDQKKVKIDKNNPAYTPKKGKFYEHDNRLESIDDEEK